MKLWFSLYDTSVINITPIIQFSTILGKRTVYIGWIVSFIAIEW